MDTTLDATNLAGLHELEALVRHASGRRRTSAEAGVDSAAGTLPEALFEPRVGVSRVIWRLLFDDFPTPPPWCNLKSVHPYDRWQAEPKRPQRMKTELTQLLRAVERGEENSSERLLPLVYDELRRLAAVKMSRERENQTLQPTALVHEAWLRLTTPGEAVWESRGHFFAAAAEAMRRILIDRARRKARLRHGGGQQRVELQEMDLADTTPDDRVLLINEALERLRAEDPEKARLVTMKFFGGLTNREVADGLQVTERTVERQWAYAKAWLLDAIRKGM